MKLKIQCSGHVYHDVSDVVTDGSDVVVTFGIEGIAVLSSKEFEIDRLIATLGCSDNLKPESINGIVDQKVVQENNRIINNTFMSIVDSQHKVCNIAYRLNRHYC